MWFTLRHCGSNGRLQRCYDHYCWNSGDQTDEIVNYLPSACVKPHNYTRNFWNVYLHTLYARTLLWLLVLRVCKCSIDTEIWHVVEICSCKIGSASISLDLHESRKAECWEVHSVFWPMVDLSSIFSKLFSLFCHNFLKTVAYVPLFLCLFVWARLLLWDSLSELFVLLWNIIYL